MSWVTATPITTSQGGNVDFQGASIAAKKQQNYTQMALIAAGIFVAYIAAKKFKLI